MGDTTISWTDKTWNPVRGCSRVSEGCRNCYAERVATRFSGPGKAYDGLVRFVTRTGGKPRPRGWSGDVRFIREHLADPLRWRKPARIFVNSMSDLFHEKLTNEHIAAVFGVMAAAPWHTFQVLTKRARRMREWFEWISDHGIEQLAIEAMGHLGDSHYCNKINAHPTWPLQNVWLGVSVENQEAANERIPELRRTPAAIRFLSCEPLISKVDLWAHLWEPADRDGTCQPHNRFRVRPNGIGWCIAGCESGPGARPCDVAWLRSLRDQCAAAGVPYFLKQATYGGPRSEHCVGASIVALNGSRKKGGGVIELPYLDGVQHAAFPEVP